jgi:hypothetical protein
VGARLSKHANTWLHFAFDAMSLEQMVKVKSDASGIKGSMRYSFDVETR